MTPTEIEARILAELPDAQVALSGSDCHFEALVVSPSLEGQSQLARQRRLLALFQQELAQGVLHALSLRATTPAELAQNSRLVSLT